MSRFKFLFIIILFFTMIVSCSLEAQTWDFIKEKDSIKLYTRKEAGKSLKAYQGVTDIKAPAEKIFTMMEDINNIDWWDKNLTKIKVLLYEKNKRAQYYMVYDLPWPVTDRDLCVDVTITIDDNTGERKITANSINGVIPENHELVRIKDYRQTWRIIPVGNAMTHLILEGFVDPAGSIPDWISNMLIIESPYKAIRGVRDRMSER